MALEYNTVNGHHQKNRAQQDRRTALFAARQSLANLSVSAVLLAALLAGGGLIPGWIAFAQAGARAPQGEPSSQPGSAGGRRRGFEAASIRIVPPGKRGLTSVGPSGSEFFIAHNASLPLLVEIAFGVSEYQISGEGKLGSKEYDITAKPWGNSRLTHKQVAPLLRQLLQQRFHLRYHYETKMVKGYALVIGKRGPKLRASKHTSGHMYILPNGLRAQSVSMAGLAAMLAQTLKRPVLNQTGLKGHYDIQLECAWGLETNSPLPSVFTAVQQELGLKLETHEEPLKRMVIDRADIVPSKN